MSINIYDIVFYTPNQYDFCVGVISGVYCDGDGQVSCRIKGYQDQRFQPWQVSKRFSTIKKLCVMAHKARVDNAKLVLNHMRSLTREDILDEHRNQNIR